MIGLGLFVLAFGCILVFLFYTVIKGKQSTVVEKKIVDLLYIEGKEVKKSDLMLKLNIAPQELENRLINLEKRNMIVNDKNSATVSMTIFGTQYYKMRYRANG